MEAGKSNKAIWFILAAVGIGTSAFFIVKHYRKKMVKQMGSSSAAPQFEGSNEVESVTAETIEQPRPAAPRKLSQYEIIMDNAIDEVIQQNIIYSSGMNPARKELMIKALQRLNLDPAFREEKSIMFRNNQDSFTGLKKALFLYGINKVH